MSAKPLFRFIQASHLELDRLCAVEGDLPLDQLRMLIDAPFRAVERIFDTALREDAELILLAGGVFSGRQPSTWGASFLARQCERVGRGGITVLWVDGGDERARCWPEFLPIPENLWHLPAASERELTLMSLSQTPVLVRVGVDAMRLQRPINASIPHGEAVAPFTIAVLAAPALSGADAPGPVDYWAVQGGRESETFSAAHGMARAAGAPQPRHSGEATIGSCLLVDVGPGYSLGTRRIETGSIRWHLERFTIDDSTNWEGFRRRVHLRTTEILSQSRVDAVCFRWTVTGHGPVIERLTQPDECRRLEQELQSTASTGHPPAWRVEIQPEPDAVQESRWRREATAYGAFVRTLDDLMAGDSPEVVLTPTDLDPAVAGEAAERRMPRPHFRSRIASEARRHASQILNDFRQ